MLAVSLQNLISQQLPPKSRELDRFIIVQEMSLRKIPAFFL